MSNRIHLCLAHMSGNEMKYIQEAFDTNWVVPLGPNVNAFEDELKTFVTEDAYHSPIERIAEKEVVALSAGTAAIHLALVQLGIKPGDEVICQSFTFAASCNPIVYQGATPVFIDSEKDTWNMDPELLEHAIQDRIKITGKKPKAIIPVYLYGMPAKIDEIMAVARKYDIPVVEDAAEGFGSRYKGQTCGTFGDFGVMSFNGNKMITTSGGGALICPNAEIKKKIMFYATQAREDAPYYLHEEIGYNYRMSNICAGIGRGQMTIVDEHIAHHQHLAKLYADLLNDVEGIDIHLAPSSDMESNYWLNTVTFERDDWQEKNGELLAVVEKVRIELDKAGVESRPLWKPMHTQPVYHDAPRYVNGISENIFSKGLCLPSGPCVSDDDVKRIVDIIRNITAR